MRRSSYRTDGTDTLTNIETLRFDDGDIDVRPAGRTIKDSGQGIFAPISGDPIVGGLSLQVPLQMIQMVLMLIPIFSINGRKPPTHLIPGQILVEQHPALILLRQEIAIRH